MSNRIARKNAQPLLEVLKEMIVQGGAKASFNARRVYSAWDTASGMGQYTTRRFFRDGKLYITLSSSVICSQLNMQKDVLIRKVNACIAGDELYIGQSADGPVKELILK